jgi:hypothetical protein
MNVASGDEKQRAELGLRGRNVQRILLAAADAIPNLLPAEMQLAQLIGHGWYRHVVRSCRSCLLILDCDAELDHEAAPIRRSIIEHTVSLIWLANSGQTAVDAIQQAHQNKVAGLIAALGEGWPAVPPETIASLDMELPSSPEAFLLHFRHQLKKFDLEVLEGPWLVETAIAHPSLRSASYFWERTGESSARPTLDTRSGNDHLPTLAGNAQMLLLATLAMNELLGGGLDSAIAEASEALGQTLELPRAHS